ncbi:MAG TPA: HAD family phosphatase [Herpetosiphonaceae bacterium]
MIKAILFDWGGVFNLKHEAIAGYDELAARYGHTPESFYDLLYGGADWQQARVGGLSSRQFWARIHRELGAADDLDTFIEALFADDRIDPVLVALAETLQPRYPLGLLSNALDDLEQLLEQRWQVSHLFEVIVNSATAGVAKPEPAAYQLAVDNLGFAPAETLFIDDKPRNVDAARALGIPTIHFTGTPALLAELAELAIIGPAERAALESLLSAPAAGQ